MARNQRIGYFVFISQLPKPLTISQPVPNHLFWDSDVAKWIEGACYFLKDHIDNEIDFAVTELVEMIRSAQVRWHRGT